MLPVVEDFVSRFDLDDFVIVADSGLMNKTNLALLESGKHKYIIGARIKNESEAIKQWILYPWRSVTGRFTSIIRVDHGWSWATPNRGQRKTGITGTRGSNASKRLTKAARSQKKISTGGVTINFWRYPTMSKWS